MERYMDIKLNKEEGVIKQLFNAQIDNFGVNTLWLSNSILKWYTYCDSLDTIDISLSSRSYIIWKHAERILLEHDEELYLVDALTTLKRAINQRLKVLDSVYHFKDIPFYKKSKGILDIMSDVGLIRPLLLHKLIDIRNSVEHGDKLPPNKDICLEMLDVVWYFIRSTDNNLNIIPETIVMQDIKNSNSSLSMDFTPKDKWCMAFYGWLPINLLSNYYKAEYIEIKGYIRTRDHEKNNYCLYGIIQGSEKHLKSLVDIYFNV
jgi:hypothetical protein